MDKYQHFVYVAIKSLEKPNKKQYEIRFSGLVEPTKAMGITNLCILRITELNTKLPEKITDSHEVVKMIDISKTKQYKKYFKV